MFTDSDRFIRASFSHLPVQDTDCIHACYSSCIGGVSLTPLVITLGIGKKGASQAANAGPCQMREPRLRGKIR
ncbi:protein of unknown function [Nitrospira defluvii]|uniref:Uncharacterized protein n=1 Tax=Nitrospira defluvii TaxID=330214 RepID=D8PAT7_9BACT|nr:protein of unknown function [Nitrospira defluvii]